MNRSKAAAVGVIGMTLLIGMSGCDGLQDPPEKKPMTPGSYGHEEPIPHLEGLKPRPAPFPVLPKGAGPIDPDAPQELTPTSTGLYYRILRNSDGRKPVPNDYLTLHFQGTLEDGRLFASSYERDEPMLGKLSSHFKGWIEGLQFVGEGGMIELFVPHYLAYGAQARYPMIDATSTLHFIVEVKDIQEDTERPAQEETEKAPQ